MRFRGAKFIDVLEVSVCEGDGTADNPCRVVKYYITEEDDGEMNILFKEDPIDTKDENEKTEQN